MKYIKIPIHVIGGIGRGVSVPRVLIVSPVLHWKVSHSYTKFWISYFMSSQNKEHLMCSYFLLKPKCLDAGEVCSLERTTNLKGDCFLKYKQHL
jgi:hypothetical protein